MTARAATPLLLLALAAPVPAGAAQTGSPATMTVEVVSLRQGKAGRRILAKVRPGDRVLLRDEDPVRFVRASDDHGTRTEEAPSGIVAMVTPQVRDGRLLLDLSATVREVAGYDTARVPVPGKPDAVVTMPNLRERNYEATAEPGFASGEWRLVHPLGDGYALSVVARPLTAAEAAAPLLPASARGGSR